MCDLYIGLVSAGPQVGLGHVVRTTAVLEALGQRGNQVCLLVEERGAPFNPDCCTINHDMVRVETCTTEEVSRAISEIASGRTSILLTDVPEAEVFDHSAARSLGCEYTVCLNAHQPVVTHVDLAFLRGYTWEIDQELPAYIRTGAEFESVHERVREIRPSEPWSGGEVNSVLITLGTADPGLLTEDVAIEAIPRFDEVDIVVGPLFDPNREKTLSKLSSQNTTVHVAPNNLPSLILDAEFVVSLGGQTAYEAMCLGRPVAGVRWGPVERAVDFHVQNGLMFDLGERDKVGMGLSLARLSPKLLQQIASSGWSCIDGNGAERMATEILALFE